MVVEVIYIRSFIIMFIHKGKDGGNNVDTVAGSESEDLQQDDPINPELRETLVDLHDNIQQLKSLDDEVC